MSNQRDNRAPPSDEPVAFDKALKETYGMVDAFNPPPAGTYYRGQHDGIIAALKTIADNFKRHAAPTPSDKQEAVDDQKRDDACAKWASGWTNAYGKPVDLSDSRKADFKQGFDAARALYAAPLAQSAEQVKGPKLSDDAILDEFEKRAIGVPLRINGVPNLNGVRVIEGVRALMEKLA